MNGKNKKASVIVTVMFMLMASSCSGAVPAESTKESETSITETEVTTTTTAESVTEPSTAETSKETESTTKAPAVSEGITGPWKCEDLASDGDTDTAFYAMYIKKNGYFSMYDFAAGNPGISGFLKNDTGSTLDVVFGTDDFDPPSCWKLDPSEDTFMYELDKDTLKLGHDGVWLIFHPDTDADWEDTEYPGMPEDLDDLLTIEIPSYLELEMAYRYNDEEWTSVVQKGYVSEDKGCFSYGIISYKGLDCLGDIEEPLDINEHMGSLKNPRDITIGGQKGSIGTFASDDTEDMEALAIVSLGDYVFEFRLTNYDEKVTEDQIKEFEKIISTVKFL